MRGEHRFVGRNHWQTARQRGLDRFQGDPTRAADQLDENVDVGGRGQRRRVFVKGRGAEIDGAVAPMTRAIGAEHTFASGPRGKHRALPLQEPNQARPDYAETRDAQAERLCHDVLSSAFRNSKTRDTVRPSCGPRSTKRGGSAISLGSPLLLYLSPLSPLL